MTQGLCNITFLPLVALSSRFSSSIWDRHLVYDTFLFTHVILLTLIGMSRSFYWRQEDYLDLFLKHSQDLITGLQCHLNLNPHLIAHTGGKGAWKPVITCWIHLELIHFSHGPTCHYLLLIHSFTRPTLILICSQIVLTLLISLCFLIISFMGRCSPVWENNKVDMSSHTSLSMYLSKVWLAEYLPSFVISGSPLPFCTLVLTV